MKKKSYVVPIVVVVVLVLAVVAMNYGKLGAVLPVGANVLSISQVNLESNNQFLNGQAWLVTLSVGSNLGQTLYGKVISPSDISSKYSGAETTEKSFSVSTDFVDSSCVYPIMKKSDLPTIKVPLWASWTCLTTDRSAEYAKAKSGFSNLIYYGFNTLTLQCYAIGYNVEYPVGSVDLSGVDSKVITTVTIDGVGSASNTISTLMGSRQGSVGDFAYVAYAGDLVDAKACPASTDVRAAYVNGNWRTISNPNYAQYSSVLINGPTSGDVSAAKSYYDTLLASSNLASQVRNFGQVQNSSSLASAQVKYVTDAPTRMPVLNLYVKASSVGVKTPTPNLRILSVSSEKFQTGNVGQLVVQFANSGESGNYNVYAACTNGFVAESEQGSIGAGITGVEHLVLRNSASEKTLGTCVVTVEDSSGKKVSSSVGVEVDPIVTCTKNPSEQFCGVVATGNDAIQRCSDDGVKVITVKECSPSQICSNLVCVERSSNGSTGTVKSGTDWFVVLKWAVVGLAIILGIVVAITLKNLFGK